MKNKLFLILVFLISFTSYAQIRFEPGYIIDNSGNRSEVLIRNMDWRENPARIEYKLSGDKEVRTVGIEDLLAFQVEGYPRYEKHTVHIDRSSDNLKALSRQRGAQFVEETLFLKILLEGEATLYQFTDTDVERYFYSVNDSPIRQLVYKQYETANRRGTNNHFRQQLLNDLNCGDVGESVVMSLNYRRDDLEKYFRNYNSCSGSETVSYGGTAEGDFNLKIKGGWNHAPLEIEREGSMYVVGHQIKFDTETSFRIGLEAEYLLPFNKNKWAVFTEPVFQQVKGEKDLNYLNYNPDRITTFEVDYSSIIIPIGIRHYFFLNNDSRLFVNAAYAYNLYVNSSITDSEGVFSDEMGIRDNNHTVEIGAGYSFRNKLGLELRYGFPRDIFADHKSTSQFPTYGEWKAVNHSFVSLILGYTIF